MKKNDMKMRRHSLLSRFITIETLTSGHNSFAYKTLGMGQTILMRAMTSTTRCIIVPITSPRSHARSCVHFTSTNWSDRYLHYKGSKMDSFPYDFMNPSDSRQWNTRANPVSQERGIVMSFGIAIFERTSISIHGRRHEPRH
jgi:hypothetical protein